MYPPPITISSLGTSEKDSAPVEDTIFFSSISIPGRDVGEEPVAIQYFLS